MAEPTEEIQTRALVLSRPCSGYPPKASPDEPASISGSFHSGRNGPPADVRLCGVDFPFNG